MKNNPIYRNALSLTSVIINQSPFGFTA